MTDDEKKPKGPMLEIVESESGTEFCVHSPSCARTREVREALERGEEPRPPWETNTTCKGPARVNSRAYRDNYDSIFGKKVPVGRA